MSGWLERAARRLAVSDGAPPEPPIVAGSPAGLTRRDAVGRAAGAGLALGAVTALGPWIANATADDYCLSKCVQAAANQLAESSDRNRSAVLKSYLTTAIGPFRLTFLAAAAVSTVSDYGDFYAARSRCRQPNCGDPGTYPPPAAGGGGSPPNTNPPGCGNDGKYVACGDQPCCNLSNATCVSCSSGPVCCVIGGNCCG